ncbi:argininosuccinate lyase [Bordetella pertussis B200]|nr:argininosuccinate lyase [Bordetella pertussis B200]
MVRPFLGTRFRPRQTLHGLGRFRQAHGAPRHPRLAGARRHAGRARHHLGPGPGRHPARHAADPLGDRRRLVPVAAGPGRRAPEHREALVELVGDAGKRLHTGRSRNDQVATDIRLWLRDEIDTLVDLLRQLRHALATVALENAATIMPGFTHLQVAQPVTFGHHLLAYAEMFGRDAERLADCRRRVNRLPLGAAALAGTSYPIDRERVARTLGFDGVCRNSLDAVSDRDFGIEFCAAGALIMTHISRLSEELVLWMSPRVGFIDLADRFCTGSSIMPQKKNPDVPELARGKTGRVNGHLVALLTLMKGQPLAYNKDNQEDKEGLFDTADTLRDTLTIFADMAGGIKVKADNMRAAALQGFATATDLADYLVKRGLPFRDAHEIVAHAVRDCEQRGCDLADLSLADLQAYHPSIGEDIHQVLTLEGSVAARKHIGGTAPERVREEAQRVLAETAGA